MDASETAAEFSGNDPAKNSYPLNGPITGNRVEGPVNVVVLGAGMVGSAIVARLVLYGQFTQKNICPPEYIGQTPGCYEHLLSEYAGRGIFVHESVPELS